MIKQHLSKVMLLPVMAIGIVGGIIFFTVGGVFEIANLAFKK